MKSLAFCVKFKLLFCVKKCWCQKDFKLGAISYFLKKIFFGRFSNDLSVFIVFEWKNLFCFVFSFEIWVGSGSGIRVGTVFWLGSGSGIRVGTVFWLDSKINSYICNTVRFHILSFKIWPSFKSWNDDDGLCLWHQVEPFKHFPNCPTLPPPQLSPSLPPQLVSRIQILPKFQN